MMLDKLLATLGVVWVAMLMIGLTFDLEDLLELLMYITKSAALIGGIYLCIVLIMQIWK